jgi:HSP20 family protein
MDREALQTSIEDGALVLGGEKKQDMRSEQDGRDRLERSYGAFMRTGTHWGGGRAHHI